MIMFLMFDCSKFELSKQKTAKWSLISVSTIPVSNSESIILFVNIYVVNYCCASFVTLVILFISGKILFCKTRLKMSRTIVFQELSKEFILKPPAQNICLSCNYVNKHFYIIQKRL